MEKKKRKKMHGACALSRGSRVFSVILTYLTYWFVILFSIVED